MIEQTNSLDPRYWAEERMKIADYYAKAGEQAVALMRVHAAYYKAHRPEHKSDASVERSWELTDEGLKLMELKAKMKSHTFRMSAIRTLLEVASNESRNNY